MSNSMRQNLLDSVQSRSKACPCAHYFFHRLQSLKVRTMSKQFGPAFSNTSFLNTVSKSHSEIDYGQDGKQNIIEEFPIHLPSQPLPP